MEMIYPMFTLMVFTLIIAIALGGTRMVAVKKRLIHPRYFQVFEGGTPPQHTVRLARNYSNLLEIPLLFYVIAGLIMALNIETPTLVGLAWAYVVSRFAHSYIHIAYNNPLHRLMMFAVSCAFLVAMWVIVLMKIG